MFHLRISTGCRFLWRIIRVRGAIAVFASIPCGFVSRETIGLGRRQQRSWSKRIGAKSVWTLQSIEINAWHNSRQILGIYFEQIQNKTIKQGNEPRKKLQSYLTKVIHCKRKKKHSIVENKLCLYQKNTWHFVIDFYEEKIKCYLNLNLIWFEWCVLHEKTHVGCDGLYFNIESVSIGCNNSNKNNALLAWFIVRLLNSVLSLLYIIFSFSTGIR